MAQRRDLRADQGHRNSSQAAAPLLLCALWASALLCSAPVRLLLAAGNATPAPTCLSLLSLISKPPLLHHLTVTFRCPLSFSFLLRPFQSLSWLLPLILS